MEDSYEMTEDALLVHIKGKISSIEDARLLKENITRESQAAGKPTQIIIYDSRTISSAFLGFLLKFKRHENSALTLIVHNDELYQTFDDMQLVSLLNIKKA